MHFGKESEIEVICLKSNITAVVDIGKSTANLIPIYLSDTGKGVKIILVINVVNVQTAYSLSYSSYSVLRLSAAKRNVSKVKIVNTSGSLRVS